VTGQYQGGLNSYSAALCPCLQTYTGGILIAVNPFEWLPTSTTP